MSQQAEVRCPFCDSGGSRPRYTFSDCQLLRCPSCTLIWLHPAPDPSHLDELYSRITYFQNPQFFTNDRQYLYGYSDYLAEKSTKQKAYSGLVSEMRRTLEESEPSGNSERRWLDVGCGLGFLLEVAQAAGFSVRGVEFNQEAASYIEERHSFPVDVCALGEARFENRFDVITMLDVIEHLQDPFGDLRRLRDVVTEQGHLIIQTMDSGSVVSRMLGTRLEDFRRTREHLFFFSRRSLRTILPRCGWQVTRIVSVGHTFRVGFLADRMSLISPLFAPLKLMQRLPAFVKDANIYLNPLTKMLIYARPLPDAEFGAGGRE